MRIKIHGHFWKFQVMETEEFDKKFSEGTETYAITFKDKREVYFADTRLNIEVVRHEIFHVFTYLCCTDSADISRSDDEEISAELFGLQGDNMVKLSRRILKQLTKQPKVEAPANENT